MTIIWGEHILNPSQSALDRLNVQRVVDYLNAGYVDIDQVNKKCGLELAKMGVKIERDENDRYYSVKVENNAA